MEQVKRVTPHHHLQQLPCLGKEPDQAATLRRLKSSAPHPGGTLELFVQGYGWNAFGNVSESGCLQENYIMTWSCHHVCMFYLLMVIYIYIYLFIYLLYMFIFYIFIFLYLYLFIHLFINLISFIYIRVHYIASAY